MFYGVDLSALKKRALHEHFAQPIVGYFYRNRVISNDTASHTVDFTTVTHDQLTKVSY
jgi:type I protein arginine methyltransferase